MTSLARVVCWIVGHDWKTERVNIQKILRRGWKRRTSMDGHDADCIRCGAIHRDAAGATGEHTISLEDLADWATYSPHMSEEDRARRWPWYPRSEPLKGRR